MNDPSCPLVVASVADRFQQVWVQWGRMYVYPTPRTALIGEASAFTKPILPAQSMDHVFDPVRSGAGGVAPGHLEKLHWAEHLGRGPDEPMEQPEFDRGEFDLAAFDRDPMACRIDNE